MNLLARYVVPVMFLWLVSAGVCLGREVYLKDGGVIEAQSAWRQGDKVFVMVNRDILADFNLNEVDLRRTFPKSSASHRRHHHRRVSSRAAASPGKSAASLIKPAPAVAAPAPKPAAQPASIPAVATTASPEPAAPAESAPVPDKAELERRKLEAARMMTEAVLKKDSELMKKAIEMQQSALSQQGAAAPADRGIPLSIPLMILVSCLLIVAAQWILFTRAGVAGWKSLVPFYNIYLLMAISGRPGWWFFLLFVPLVGVAIYLMAMLSLAKKFGRSELFGVGIFLLPMFFLPVLAFGGSEYQG